MFKLSYLKELYGSSFLKLKADDFNFEEQKRLDKPSTTEQDQMKSFIENN